MDPRSDVARNQRGDWHRALICPRLDVSPFASPVLGFRLLNTNRAVLIVVNIVQRPTDLREL